MSQNAEGKAKGNAEEASNRLNALDSAPVMIAQPTYDWEKVRFTVEEGPAVLRHGNRIFVTFSASGTGPEYCMGLLSISQDDDLLDAGNWREDGTPDFGSPLMATRWTPATTQVLPPDGVLEVDDSI